MELPAMTPPLVSVITPTANRPEMLERCIAMFMSQDYPNKEMIVVHGDYTNVVERDGVRSVYFPPFGSLGEKRNRGALCSRGQILMPMDDDDLYAPDWISKSVRTLQTSGADIVGLSNSYFYETARQQMYELIPKGQLYLLGATLCYWKHVWERKPFPNISKGEDTAFISNNGRLHCHGYKEGFIATVHGGNTECHKALPLLRKTDTKPALLRQWYQ